ncbi:MAG: ribosome maturation factor RimM [Sphaerochaetaceae bacterium]|nr:ribosome maturation factor RimM [Sphaerochaetaceae bacterium]
MKQVLATGTVKSAFGVNGKVKVASYSGDTDHFFKLTNVVLEKKGRRREAEVEKVERHFGELLVKFKGIDTPEDAKAISGCDILVPREQASKLKNGEVYAADLIGMKLLYDNQEVGVVAETAEGSQALLLEVDCSDGKRRIIPLLRGVFVDNPDVEEGTIRLLMKELVQ